MAAKTVAVIGAGASGLAAIKCCIDEGLDVVCFERTDCIGGLWYYTEEVRDGQACVMKSTIINANKEVMCYSDFPIPKEYPNFMHHTLVLKYFNLYADRFNLKKYIKFKTEVLSVKPTSDHSRTGRWDIRIKDKLKGTETDRVFDAVLICTGHHADINKPSFPGMENFKGTILHSHDYKHPRGFEDKRVLVVGIGNSGGDVATELSRTSSQVLLSTRRGTWIMSRVTPKGIPLGMLNSRYLFAFRGMFPSYSLNLTEKILNQKFDHAKYGLRPNHRFNQAHPTVNDDLPNRILSGTIKVEGNVKRFTETGAEFEDGTYEENIDAVILATGYIFGFPFLDKRVLDAKDNKVDLYKRIFPPNSEKHTLGIIGCYQSIGAVMPIAEMQCRVAARVFKGLVKLPSSADMWKDIKMKQALLSKRYVETLRHTMQVDFVPMMDELAKMIGCKPNLWSLFLKDPKLALSCCFGPCIPGQYRLVGPGSWDGARDTILTTWERSNYPLNTRAVTKQVQKSSYMPVLSVIAASLIAVAVYILRR